MIISMNFLLFARDVLSTDRISLNLDNDYEKLKVELHLKQKLKCYNFLLLFYIGKL
jgi:hypothetical protein